MKRIPLVDWAVFGGIPLVALAAAIWTFLTPQEWPAPKLIVIIAATLAFIGVGLAVLLPRLLKKPSYITVQGVYVWNCSTGPRQIDVERALGIFLQHLPTEDVAKMLEGARIEFRPDPVGAAGIGWLVKDKAGLQQGNAVLLHWTGSIEACPFFHELLHMYDELVRAKNIKGWQPDYKHEDASLWLREGGMNEDFKRKVSAR